MIALIDKWDEVFLLIYRASTLSFALLNVPIEKLSHGSVIVKRSRLIQGLPASDDLGALTVSDEIIFGYFAVAAWDLFRRSSTDVVEK